MNRNTSQRLSGGFKEDTLMLSRQEEELERRAVLRNDARVREQEEWERQLRKQLDPFGWGHWK
jgi:hypothetical protein